MTSVIESALPMILAEGDVQYFPLHTQIACILLTGLFLWTFSIARDPRGWRRLYQSKFARRGDFSVNKNKKIDESIKKWGIIIAMIFLVLDVFAFVYGITYPARSKKRALTDEERFHQMDIQRLNSQK